MLEQKINSKIVLLIIIFAIIFAGVLYYYFLFDNKINQEEKAEKVLIPSVIINFNGAITAKQGNILSVEIFDLTKDYYEPFGEHPKEIRRVEVGPETKIIRLGEKNASINDLSIGDTIEVLASENIKYKKEFVATEITYLPPIPEIIEGF